MFSILHYRSNEKQADAIAYCFSTIFKKISCLTLNIPLKKQLDARGTLNDSFDLLNIDDSGSIMSLLKRNRKCNFRYQGKDVEISKVIFRKDLNSFKPNAREIIFSPYYTNEDFKSLCDIENLYHPKEIICLFEGPLSSLKMLSGLDIIDINDKIKCEL